MRLKGGEERGTQETLFFVFDKKLNYMNQYIEN